MSGRVAGKVALITGAARGQGRSHAVRLAEEGADIIAIDSLTNCRAATYDMATQSDLDETVKLVSELDRRIVARQADVRDSAVLSSAIDEAVGELGRLDIVCVNAGIQITHAWDQVTDEAWREVLDTNLTGAWYTCRATIPHLIRAGGGSIICTSSVGGVKGLAYMPDYVASKHGVLGLARSLSTELARHKIRVNTILPAVVDTPMAHGTGELLFEWDPQASQLYTNTFPVDILEARDISNAVLFLASEEARYITGVALPVDAGNTNR